ncbi:hypothetical protein [Ideonella sp. YS5]|uniref:hypothetical protein n=1 Tax=Ideonella sp. YS5 TaxID=3453714 RepID=UPI003EEE316F
MNIVEFSTANYLVRVSLGSPPSTLDTYRQKAVLCDSHALSDLEAQYLFVAVAPNEASWPTLVVEQRYESHQVFHPGVLVVPEEDTLFIGAGTRLLAYSLVGTPRRLWEDQTDVGFFCWRLHEGIVLMSAELELAAWSNKGEKLWSSFVEPPWHYTVEGDRVTLDVMGTVTSFRLSAGPKRAP